MESTKSTTIAWVAGLLLAVPVWAQDRTHVNSAVELTEHVQDVQQGEPYAQEDSADPVYDQQVQLAQAAPQQDYDGMEDAEPVVEAQADLVADEEAYIPRGRSDAMTGTVMRTAQTDTPWYRNPFTSLLVVLGVIGAVAAMVRRWVPAARTVNSDQLQVIGRTAISSKQSVVLLHVGERVVLLGVTPEAVNTLSEITDESEVARLLGRSKSNEAVQSKFDSVLTREFEQYETAETAVTEIEEPEASVPVPVTEAQVVANEPATPPVTAESTNGDGNRNQNGRKSPLHLNDLLSKLRSLQKT